MPTAFTKLDSQAQQAFGPLSPSAAFLQLRGVSRNQEVLMSFGLHLLNFRWPGNFTSRVFHGVFFPNKGIRNIGKMQKNNCISIVNTLQYGTLESLQGTKKTTSCACVIHPSQPFPLFRKRLSLALYNQFEHPEGTEVGGSDWEEVKEIYAEARA